MKRHSDDLFTLIKSLDPREKVFFKVYSANKGSQKNSLSYLQLFDVIDKLKTYDKSMLIAKLKKSGFKHHFNKAKKYLAEAISNSLMEYHFDISVNAKLQKLLHYAEVLIKKRLIALAKKTLLKAEKLSLEYELYDYWFVIRSLKTSILRTEMNPQDTKAYLNHGIPQVEKHFDYLKNIIEFNNLASEVRVIAVTNSQARGRDINKITSLLSSTLLSSPDKALSFSARRDYYTIHITCSKLLDKWDNLTCQRQKEWVTYLESDKTKFAERTNIYLDALSNLMGIQLEMDRMHEAEKLYEKIKKIYFSLTPKKRTKSILASLTGITSNIMGKYTKRGIPEKSLKAWEHIKSSVSLNKLNHSHFLAMCYNLSHSHFMVGNYHEALKWINKIGSSKGEERLDIQVIARIYSLLIYYELGNYDMLPHVAKSSHRFLIKYGYLGKFEKIMLYFFEREITKTGNNQEKTEVFRQLKEQIQELLKGSQKIRALEDFDYMSWIESKIENRPFAEIVRSRHRTNPDKVRREL